MAPSTNKVHNLTLFIMDRNSIESEWLDMADMLRHFHISRSTVYNYINEGLLHPYQFKVKGHPYFRYDEVVAALKQRREFPVHRPKSIV